MGRMGTEATEKKKEDRREWAEGEGRRCDEAAPVHPDVLVREGAAPRLLEIGGGPTEVDVLSIDDETGRVECSQLHLDDLLIAREG